MRLRRVSYFGGSNRSVMCSMYTSRYDPVQWYDSEPLLRRSSRAILANRYSIERGVSPRASLTASATAPAGPIIV